jgi:hypothetical protein
MGQSSPSLRAFKPAGPSAQPAGSSSWVPGTCRHGEATTLSVINSSRIRSKIWFLNEAKNFEVLYEQAHRIPGTQTCSAELLRPLKAWCLERGITPQPVDVGQIKRFWTSYGNATKEEMVAEARLRGFDPVDTNEATALALLHCRIIEGPTGRPWQPELRQRSAAHRKPIGERVCGAPPRCPAAI